MSRAERETCNITKRCAEGGMIIFTACLSPSLHFSRVVFRRKQQNWFLTMTLGPTDTVCSAFQDHFFFPQTRLVLERGTGWGGSVSVVLLRQLVSARAEVSVFVTCPWGWLRHNWDNSCLIQLGRVWWPDRWGLHSLLAASRVFTSAPSHSFPPCTTVFKRKAFFGGLAIRNSRKLKWQPSPSNPNTF